MKDQANRDKVDANAQKIASVIQINRKEGYSYQHIAKVLNELKVETARGSNWHMGTVRRYDLRRLEQQHRAI